MEIYVLEAKQVFADKDNTDIQYTEGDLLATKDKKRKKDLVKRGLADVLGTLKVSSTDKSQNDEKVEEPKDGEPTDNQKVEEPKDGEPTDNQKVEEPKKDESTDKNTSSKNSNSKK